MPVVIVTAHGAVERAVEAMKKGAYDFVPKPFEPDHRSSGFSKKKNLSGWAGPNPSVSMQGSLLPRIEIWKRLSSWESFRKISTIASMSSPLACRH